MFISAQDQDIMELGKEASDMAKELWNGKMELLTLVCGKWVGHMDKVYLRIPKVKSIKAHGITIKLKGMEFIFKQMDQNMKENGFKTYNMAKVKNNGQMDQILKENIRLAKKTD